MEETHFAVPVSFELGAYSLLQDLGMELWASGGRWAGRRLAAVSYVLDNNGSPLPAGWDWAARSLGFVAPNPPIRPISRVLPVPIPTVADAQKQKKSHAKDPNANVETKDTSETTRERAATKNRPTDTQPIPEE